MLMREEKALKEFQRQLLEKFKGEILYVEEFVKRTKKIVKETFLEGVENE